MRSRSIDSLLDQKSTPSADTARDESRGDREGLKMKVDDNHPSSDVAEVGSTRVAGGKYGQVAHVHESEVYTDIYGEKPHSEKMLDEHVAALEHELARIPHDRKRSLLKAQKNFPLLLVASSHTKIVLQDQDFDPKNAAERLARYWDTRERMYGDTAFSSDCFNEPRHEDYVLFYEKSLATSSDPEADEFTRELSREYIRCVNQAKIDSFHQALETMPPHEKTALIEAEKRCPDLATSDAQKLIFLHSDNYVENHAACRMVKYWARRFDLFGPDRAVKPITLDLLKEHSFEIELGYARLLPGTDASGRALISVCPGCLLSGGYTKEGILSAVWYVFHAALEKECCRKNGVVVLVNHLGDGRSSQDNQVVGLRQEIISLVDCTPVKLRAVHICCPPTAWWWPKFLNSLFNFIGSRMKKRIVLHEGTDAQIVAGLQQFGISRDQVPRELGGSLEFDTWKEWLRERRAAGL